MALIIVRAFPRLRPRVASLDRVSRGRRAQVWARVPFMKGMPLAAAPLRVLAADDEPCFLEALTAFLEGSPELDLVGCARDGAEAVELAESLNPDVVLMDLDMPRLDGLEATRRIRATAPSTVVVIVTGSDLAPERAYAAGARACVSKTRVWSDLPGSVLAASELPVLSGPDSDSPAADGSEIGEPALPGEAVSPQPPPDFFSCLPEEASGERHVAVGQHSSGLRQDVAGAREGRAGIDGQLGCLETGVGHRSLADDRQGQIRICFTAARVLGRRLIARADLPAAVLRLRGGIGLRAP